MPFSVAPTRPDDLPALAADTAKPPQPVPAALAPGGDGEDPDGDDDEDDPPSDEERGRRLAEYRTRAGDGRTLALLPAARRSAILKQHKGDMRRLTTAGAAKLRAFWRQQGERIADAAKRSALTEWPDGKGRIRAFVLPHGQDPTALIRRDIAAVDWDDEERRLAQLLRDFYVLSGETAFAALAGSVGVEIAFDLANPNVRRVLRDLAERPTGLRAVHQKTRDDVARVVGEALDEGAGLDDLAARLRSLFAETYRNRAMTVARTETQQAYNRAAALGYEESGVVGASELVDNPNHTDGYGASDGLTCAQRHGLVVALSEVPRHVDGEHPNGSLAALPVLAKPLGEL
jgi:hypothetical protein